MITLPSARRIATPTELGLSVMFGLKPSLAAVLARMLDGEAVNTLRTRIHELRGAMGSEAIDTTVSGYRLTEVGVIECNQALSDFRSWVSEERAA